MGAFTGALRRSGDAGFSDAALANIFNGRLPARRPAAVLRAADAADVAAGVKLAAAEGWQVSVRSGGHSWDAWSLREDALLIDLAALNGMRYSADTGIAAVGPAVRSGLDLDPFLATHDRFFAVGHHPTVSMGGFLLQGGMGWNCRGWGWAAESVASMDVVTASGEAVRCSETENADLFWSARGSGPGFFGVVTEFRLRTRPRHRSLTRSTSVYPAELAADVLTWFSSVRHEVDASVGLLAVGAAPSGLDSPVVIIDGISFDGGPSSLAPLETCPVADRALKSTVARPTDMGELFAEQSDGSPSGLRYFVDNAYVTGAASELVPAVAPALADLPTSETFTILSDFSPQLSRDLPDMAVSLRPDLYFAAYVVSRGPADDARCRSWLDATMDRLAPFSEGCYLGDSDLTVRPDRILSDAAWSRLQRIRAARDPEGRFPGYLGTPVQ
ncbi:FAD-binding oxidoreductase [Streptomyces avicenniae]|uniref:FAD-binding oxidoreductase n=1 Tax=Streptomyces avicenniae TaxID=500153 RepID=UPI00069AD678|nr:FAD-binding oxidoreductase [Streptomyces avicenniae]